MENLHGFGRTFNQQRKEQGFRSQAHLDAFYMYFDHTKACAECQKPGKGALFDDGYQPTHNRCDIALELDRAQHLA